MIVNLRRAGEADADAVADVWLRSRAEAMPWLAVVHTPEEVRAWVGEHLIPGAGTWVAVVDERVVGVAAIAEGWLEQLYVLPEAQGHGVGRSLLDVAKEHSGGHLRLHVFRRNTRAQRFYASAGFVVTGGTEGDNEEGEPDLVMTWRPDGEPEDGLPA
ncbi:GNAT family N-acetyltransferase [Kineococcus glutinatus]|uniref:GNAT family N-acetyltransferase n=1 Tax=Kineococcus glutinatus TaxID=1070872 RepID=A0ABP9HPI2_9ACTN